MSEVISSFRNLKAGSQMFALHVALWYVVLVCHQYDVYENAVGSVYVGGYSGLSESGP